MTKRQSSSEDKNVTDAKIFSVLSYLSILCIIPLIFKKNNRFALHHGRQGLVLFLSQVAVFLAHILLGQWVLKLGIFVLGVVSFVGIIAVLKGEYIKLPFVYEIAEKITL